MPIIEFFHIFVSEILNHINNYIMKKTILLVAIGFALTTQTICAQVPSYVPTNGLVGYWPFNGNANDESGNGNNGSVNGATLTTDRFGNSNSAYNFDGISNNVNLPLQQNGVTAYTVSAWFKTSIGGPVLSGRGSSNQVGLSLGVHNIGTGGNVDNGKSYFRADGPFTSVGKKTSNTYIDNQWHQIVGVYNGAIGTIVPSQFSIYIDNILVAQIDDAISSSSAPINNGTNLLIGSHQVFPNGGKFNGLLDDVGIWNRALTEQEIANLYNANQCITNITVTDTLIINVGQLSFIDPVTWANNITIAPNPASSQININFNNITNLNGGTLKIINSLGQEVATTSITTSGTNSTMQLATWGGTGMYFVQIINPQGQIVDIKKIILQ